MSVIKLREKIGEINMKRKDLENIRKATRILKKQVDIELESLLGEEGSEDEIIEMINEKFNVKADIIYSSSSQPVIGFDLPIYVRCEMGTKDRPSTTSEFTVKNVGINTSQIR